MDITTVIKADKSHKSTVLSLLDNFRTYVNELIDPDKQFVSTSAKDYGGKLFDQLIKDDGYAIFLAKDEKEFIGTATVSAIPLLRKGKYYAEIEEMFVQPAFHGSGTAKALIDAITEWCQEKGIKELRLESGNELERAHAFYQKAGFKEYAKAFKKKIKNS